MDNSIAVTPERVWVSDPAKKRVALSSERTYHEHERECWEFQMKMHAFAAALAIATPAGSPAQHWYTEDTKYQMCTTVDHAYDFIGAPKTPEELANALGRLGTPYDVIRNDNGVAILQAQITKLPIPLFKSESECTETLKQVLEKRGVTYGSPFFPGSPRGR